ncbi:unnamed protein product [Withania somnifera]
MFPFGNSSDGNPTLYCSVPPSSFHSSNSSILGLNGNQILLHQHDLDHHLPYLAPNSHLIDNNGSAMFAINNVVINNSNNSNSTNQGPLSKSKKTVKKDRHSKILTSQGHRDRRVRLSKGVARNKTLDWLFTRAKLDIEELNAAKKNATPTSVNNSEYDEDVVVPAAEADELTKRGKQEKESRAKARARARERTIKKMTWTQIEAKSLVVKEQTMMERIMNLSGPNREAAASHYNNCTRYWNHDEVNPTIMSSMAAATICCTSLSQDQKAWHSYHGSQL